MYESESAWLWADKTMQTRLAAIEEIRRFTFIDFYRDTCKLPWHNVI